MKIEILEKNISKFVLKLKKKNLDINVFNHEEILYGTTIGRGGEGVVKRCSVKYNDIMVDAAIKKPLCKANAAFAATFEEIEMLCLARDRIIGTTVEVFGLAAIPDSRDPSFGHLAIIMEVGIKNLHQLYKDEIVPLHVTFEIWNKLALALHCIHNKGIIHQDLKPENILITGIFRDKYGAIDKVALRIIDLGMACFAANCKVNTKYIFGTVGYHAPELFGNKLIDFSADLFVLGITFCVMLFSKKNRSDDLLVKNLKKIDEAKKHGLVGKPLFSVIKPKFDKKLNLEKDIIQMICLMLESVERRKITLLEVAARCSAAAATSRQLVSHVLREDTSKTDSGIGEDASGKSFGRRSVKKRRPVVVIARSSRLLLPLIGKRTRVAKRFFDDIVDERAKEPPKKKVKAKDGVALDKCEIRLRRIVN